MYSLFLGIVLIGFVLCTLGKWTIEYLRDPKALRRFPNMNTFAGITNIPYLFVSYGGFRSKHVYQLHAQGQPIIRIGPNSLSFSSPKAIKDIYGHSESN